MNYHIMIDDKFIDSFIEDAEKVSQPNSNIYYVRGSKGLSTYVRHPLAIRVDIMNAEFIKVLHSITVMDKIVIHWYDLTIGKLLLLINKNIPLYVVHWGGDFYEDPFLYHLHWIFDAQTLKYVKKVYIFPKKWSINPFLFIKQLYRILNYKNAARQSFLIKKQTVHRINYLLIDPNNVIEVELTKKIYERKELPFLPFQYDQNLEITKRIREIKKNDRLNLNIFIGNSATEANNHIECFEIMEKFKNENVNIIVPLSYGDKDYVHFVKSQGERKFGNKFITIENFMARSEYAKLLDEIDVCVMYHNRSQAFGNCVMLIALGKKLFLKGNNSLMQLFKQIGIVLFDARLIRDLTFEEFSKPLTTFEINSNIEKISGLFSETTRLNYLSKILI